MSAYLITGPNGSGKSTVGRVLASRGYKVIEMDHEPGLSGWVDAKSREKVVDFPPHPLSQEWLTAHAWVWFRDRFEEIVAAKPEHPIFFCGGAYNQHDFYHLFTQRFTLYLDDETTTQRLQLREPERWQDGSAELKSTLAWNAKSKQISIEQGSVVIDGVQDAEEIADQILSHVIKDMVE